jgi:deoxyribose-phosphate aldolase
MVNAGATRLGASAGVKIVQGQLESNGNGQKKPSAAKADAY